MAESMFTIGASDRIQKEDFAIRWWHRVGLLKEKVTETGVVHQTFFRYTPKQNGRADTLNRKLLDKLRWFRNGVPAMIWAEAIDTAIHLPNRMRSIVEHSPDALFTGIVPIPAALRVL